MQLILLKIFHQFSVIVNGDCLYDFSNAKINNSILNKHYGLLHVILILSGFSYSLYGKCTYVYSFMTVPLLVFDFITTCLICILNLVIIYSSQIRATRKLHGILKIFMSIERNFKHFTAPYKNPRVFSMMFMILICCGVLIYDVIVWLEALTINFSQYHLFQDVQYFVIFVKLFYVRQLLNEVLYQIVYVKNLFWLVMNDYLAPIEEPEEGNEEYTITGWTKSELEKSVKEERSKLKLVTKTFNEIFSAWHSSIAITSDVVTIFHIIFVVEFLQMTSYIIGYYFGNLSNSAMESVHFIILRVVWSFTLSVRVL